MVKQGVLLVEDDILYNRISLDNMERLKSSVPFRRRWEIHVLTLIIMI
jgi:hypothetical protein